MTYCFLYIGDGNNVAGKNVSTQNQYEVSLNVEIWYMEITIDDHLFV